MSPFTQLWTYHLHYELPHVMKNQLECEKEMVIRVMKDLEILSNEAQLKELEMVGVENEKLGRKHSKTLTMCVS